MLPDSLGGYPATPERRRRSWPLPVLLVVLLVVASAYVIANHYTSNDYAIAPGSAQSVQPFISVPSADLHKHKGQILLVTVSLLTVTPYTWIGDKLDSNIQILKVQELTGNTPPSQLNQENQVEMQTSTQTAVIVALRRLGYTVNQNGQGAEVDAVVSGTPAANILAAGDVIVSFDGTPIQSSDELTAAILKHKPGDKVQFQVQVGSPPKTVTKSVTLGQAPANTTTPSTHAFLGIETSTKEEPKLPLNVSIDPGNIGGPSAGLAFTLGIIDDLTSGDLTGGKTIAVTGTINPDGTVGDVGGVAQKAVAVRRAGAVAFLVPPQELKTAQQHAGSHVKVIAVSTLEQALNALRSLGGDVAALPPAPPATAGS
jgi:PDZ domain-containing protein